MEKRKINWIWPKIDSVEVAEKTVNFGTFAAGFVCVATVLFMAFGQASLTAWVDVILFVGLGVGIHMRSRAAAAGATILFVLEKIYLWSVAGNIQGFPVAAILFCYFASAYRATVYLHRVKTNPPAPETSSENKAA